MRGAALACAACLTLAGCGEDDLARCLFEAEPTILLREMGLTGKPRELYDYCRNGMMAKAEFCRGLYLSANTPVRECMRLRGFTFTDPDSGYGACDWQEYADPACYSPTWLAKAKALVAPRPKKKGAPSS